MADDTSDEFPTGEPQKRGRGRPKGSKTMHSMLPWRDALRQAVMREHPETGAKYLDMIAQRCVVSALQGDMGAINEIGNRLDGRHVTLGGDPDNPITLVSRIERVIVDVAQEQGGTVEFGPNDDRTTH